MVYNHNNKAGNQGDVVKHVALITAIKSLCTSNKYKEFHFTDIFSGYAYNPIINGNEWVNGIGNIKNCSKISNENIKLYFKWYLSRPNIIGTAYPGSSLITYDVLKHCGTKPKLVLYDISEKVVKNLKTIYNQSEHSIINRPATVEDKELSETNFLFIDPPSLYSYEHKDYPKLEDLLIFENIINDKNILIWLPIDDKSSKTIDLLRKSNYQISKIKWSNKKGFSGCLMAYKLPKETVIEIRACLDEIVEISNWKSIVDNPIRHYDSFVCLS